MNQPKTIILVKIQQSLNPSDTKRVLVYDKSRSFTFESADPGVVTPLIEKLGDKPKKYFKASIEGQELKIHEEIEDQTW